jgi:hypothetical protein
MDHQQSYHTKKALTVALLAAFDVPPAYKKELPKEAKKAGQ